MKADLAQQAVTAALSGNWEEARQFNIKILSEDPDDIDALNRLARAYAESGQIQKAKSTSRKVLNLDPYNSIAVKCIGKWSNIKNGNNLRSHGGFAEDFIEEPGKTKIITLMHTGPISLLNSLDAGDEVKLNPHGHRLSVSTLDGKYIGKLPDDIAAKLKGMMKLGNAYNAVIKSIKDCDVRVFIREIKTCPELADVPSFTTEKIDYVSFTPPELVHNKKDMQITEELEE